MHFFISTCSDSCVISEVEVEPHSGNEFLAVDMHLVIFLTISPSYFISKGVLKHTSL